MRDRLRVLVIMLLGLPVALPAYVLGSGRDRYAALLALLSHAVVLALLDPLHVLRSQYVRDHPELPGVRSVLLAGLPLAPLLEVAAAAAWLALALVALAGPGGPTAMPPRTLAPLRWILRAEERVLRWVLCVLGFEVEAVVDK